MPSISGVVENRKIKLMSKSYRIDKTEEYKHLARELGVPWKDLRKKLLKMQEYEAQYTCGCCYATLFFPNDETAQKAVQKLGHYDIIDAIGQKHEKIDAFYGIWRKKD